MMRVPAPLRFIGMVGALVLVFGLGGGLFLGALDKAQTNSTASLFDPGALAGFVTHFVQQFINVITIGHDRAGTPFRVYLLQGAATTLQFCFLAMPLALILGLALALMSRSSRSILRLPARAYVEFFRDTPLLVQLLAIYWGFTFLGPTLVNAFTAGLATLVLNYAAYECENLRAGFAALDKGQSEAAAALGLSGFQSLRLVVLPQMISIVLPPVLNDLIYLFKDSAVLNLIAGIVELTTQVTALQRRAPALSWQFFFWVGIVYLLLSLPLSRVAGAAERRLKATAFQPKYDVVLVALGVLGAMALVGWLCGVALDGFSLKAVAERAGLLLSALELTLGVMLLALLTLGVVVYVPSQVFKLTRGATRRREERQAAMPVAAPTK